MKALTEADIRGSFVNARPDEALGMPLPGLHEMLWDEREYLGWRDPGSPQRGYVVSWQDGQRHRHRAARGRSPACRPARRSARSATPRSRQAR